MKTEFYIYGSLVSGDVDKGSDVDVLAVLDEIRTKREFPESWSIYTVGRLREMFARGTLFAWHVYLESKLIFPEGSKGVLTEIGPPARYENAATEVAELAGLAEGAVEQLKAGTSSKVFEHGLLYLAVRDIGMAASNKLNGRFNFSKFAACQVRGIPLPLTREQHEFLMHCRRASVRGTPLAWSLELESSIREKWQALLEWCQEVYFAVK